MNQEQASSPPAAEAQASQRDDQFYGDVAAAPEAGSVPPPAGGYPTTNGTAIMALVATLVPIPVVGAVLGVVLGIFGLREIRRYGQTGPAIAIAAIVLGAMELIFVIVLLLSFGFTVGAIIRNLQSPQGRVPPATFPTSAATAPPPVNPAPTSYPTASGGTTTQGQFWMCVVNQNTGFPGESICTKVNNGQPSQPVAVSKFVPFKNCAGIVVTDIYASEVNAGLTDATVGSITDWNQLPLADEAFYHGSTPVQTSC